MATAQMVRSKPLQANQATANDAVAKIMAEMYEELRHLASRSLCREHSNRTLQTTELVHEAYLRLANQRNVTTMDAPHFRAAVANVMRRILVDHARSRLTQRRGGGAPILPLDTLVAQVERRGFTLPALDEALERLAHLDHRKSRVIELRFFGGLSVEEVSSVLCVRRRTVERDWTFAKAWLRNELYDVSDRRRAS